MADQGTIRIWVGPLDWPDSLHKNLTTGHIVYFVRCLVYDAFLGNPFFRRAQWRQVVVETCWY